MKILYVINALTIGGAQTFLLDICRYFVKENNKIYVVAFRSGELENKLKEAGVEVYILGEAFFDLIAFIKLVKLIRIIKPEIIHTHLFRATMWSRFARLFNLSSCLITTIHGKESKFYSWFEKYTQFLSDKLVFSSNYLLNWYNNCLTNLNGLNEITKKEKVLYPGTKIYNKRSYVKCYNGKQLIIGTMSRLHCAKGLDFLLNALSKIKKQNFKLLIAGTGKEKENLIKLAKELNIKDKCDFLGYIEDKKSFLEQLDLFISPSREEGFGINICEALERSVPVYASNVGGIKEIIQDGYNGKLFIVNYEYKNVEKFVNLLNNAFNTENKNEFVNLANSGRCSAETKFNRENTIYGHISMYKDILDEKNKKIHFLVSSSEMGGGEHLALGLMKSLISRGYDVSLTCAGDPLKLAAKNAGVKVSCASMCAGGFFYALKAAKDILRIKPSYLSLHLNKAGLIGGYLGKLFGIKTIAHVHGLNRLSYYKNSDKIIAVSKAVKEHLCKQGKTESEVELICNCIDKPALLPKTLNNKHLQIAITAKLHANKGHKWALLAIANNIDKLNLGCIHIIGDGPENENLHELCSKEPLKSLVKFHGYVSDVDKIYEYIDIALLPSAGEGIPLSLLEAMRFGIPCIATNRGGIPEIVTNKYNGLLIPYCDEEALIKAINELSKQETYKIYSENSINAFKHLNNYEKMVDDFEKLL